VLALTGDGWSFFGFLPGFGFGWMTHSFDAIWDEKNKSKTMR